MNALLAVNWEPELRGILIVIISVSVLCGSVYLILGTNLGARLGFLVALTGLAGWMFIMGAIWWSYGKGLLGEAPSWQPVAGQTVLREARALSEVGILDAPIELDSDPSTRAEQVEVALQDDGWLKLDAALPEFQQAGSAGTVLMEESEALKAGEFTVVNVFDRGGERWPTLWGDRIDFIAFFHEPRFALVEVAPLVPQRVEPGRAPARPIIDTTRNHEYVYMIRDLGNLRVPAAIITIASFILLVVLSWLLHRRDRFVAENRAADRLPAKV
ncbi:MAG: hypothetical protein RJB61_1577 [Actinomycetota bacterium]|jgi:hypothetical protein